MTNKVMATVTRRESSLNLMIKLNADESSKFYGKIDIDKVGSAGHSQGGAGAVNAVLRYGHSENYKAIYTASNTNSALSDYLGWGYDPSAIKAAYFGVAGTGNTDAGDATKEGLGAACKTARDVLRNRQRSKKNYRPPQRC